jgi:phosphoribosyl-ATP pyrophosphohydrolase
MTDDSSPVADADDADGTDTETRADNVLDALFATIEARKRDRPQDSYTASLFAHEKDENAVLEKLGGEATEVIPAAKDDDESELLHEPADFVYHPLVLLAMKDLDVADLRDELEARF